MEEKEKLTNIIYKLYLFCRQGHFKQFLENYRFCRKSGNDTYSRGWGLRFLRHCDALRTKIDM